MNRYLSRHLIGITRKGISLLLLFSLVGCASLPKDDPRPLREFRGVWIATVANIDWPKHPEDNHAKKQADFLEILDFYRKLNFNAAIVQIRTAGDAFYPTDKAPWSRFLTGEEGRAPQHNFDYLDWMIAETHKRGMEFHAWLNPYRATTDLDTTKLSLEHDFYQHPDWMLAYGKKYYYNPGLPEVQEHLVEIMEEIVSEYDVDAIHFDDYFYPYKVAGETFEDSEAYKAYAQPNQSLDDWRRANIDSLVQQVNQAIKQTKPWVQFGISPFGVWKNKSTDPKGSDTKAGQTTYEDLYADPLLWMEKGWIDYLIPQAYWSMDYPAAAHRKLVAWWAPYGQNTNIYIGNGPYKIRSNADKAWDNPQELPKQLKLARNTPNIKGNAFFSAKSLMQDHADVVQILQKEIYSHPALPPQAITPSQTDSGKPKVIPFGQAGTEHIFLYADEENPARMALVYGAKKEKHLQYTQGQLLGERIVDPLGRFSISQQRTKHIRVLGITFIDRYGRESEPYIVPLKK